MTTIYEQFIEEMENNGFKKVCSVIDEVYADLSDDDDAISITAHSCHMVTIKGMKQSERVTKEYGRVTSPHNIYMKLYGNDGKEFEHNDMVQFSIVESVRKGLPTMDYKDDMGHRERENRCIYYSYPYRSVSTRAGIRFKRGMAITKDKKLEIKAIRNSLPLKIGKFELAIECDMWNKVIGEMRGKLTGY